MKQGWINLHNQKYTFLENARKRAKCFSTAATVYTYTRVINLDNDLVLHTYNKGKEVK